jgi:acetyltransferase-like isoleucine patch superfamily enzyme
MSTPDRRQVGIRDVDFGPGVVVYEPCNLYECRIGADSFVGPFVEIQAGAVIGARCRIQSHTFIPTGVEIGDDCFVGHGVMFINDLFRDGQPAYNQPEKWLKTKVDAGVTIGSNATILPVRIVAGAVIGAGAVVTRDIMTPGVYAGNPARLLRSIDGLSAGADGSV